MKRGAELPVWKVILGAFAVVWLMKGQFLNKISISILALVALGYVQSLAGNAWSGAGLLFGFLQLCVYAYFAVICHRMVLLGGKSVPVLGVRKWTSRETRFLGWLVGIYVMAGAVTLVLGVLAASLSPLVKTGESTTLIWLFVATDIPGLYLLSRLSVIFPATAVDERPDIKWAWDITHGNGWRLFTVVGVLPVVMGLLLSLLQRPDSTLTEDLLVSLLSFIALTVEIAAISLSYRELAAVQIGPVPEQ